MLRVRLLYPLNVGSKIWTAKLVEELSRDHDITLVAYRYPDDTDLDVRDTERFCKRVVTLPFQETPKRSPAFYAELLRNVADRRPYMIAKYATDAMAREVARVYNEERPDLVICDFPHSCEGMARLPDVPYLLFQHNVEAAIFEQLAARADSPLKRCYLGLQAHKMRAYEARRCREAAHVIAVSDIDREAYAREFGVTRCDTVPTGVDIDFFKPDLDQEKRFSLVFTGSMDWLANQDAMRWFVADLLPLIRAEIPDVDLTIVGRNPPPSIVALGETPGVTVTGTVNDIRPYVRGAEVYVVPLRIGSGTRLKLVEAMAMGKAIVSTSIGAEGLPVVNGREMLIADEPDAFAGAVVHLLTHGARRTELGINARTAAVERHSWQYAGRIFAEICRETTLKIKEQRA